MVIFPLSKINIGLNIIRKRDDGYHDLQTIFVPVGWTDVLEVVPSSGEKTTLRVTGNPCQCPMEKNLVIKALRAVENSAGTFLRSISFCEKSYLTELDLAAVLPMPRLWWKPLIICSDSDLTKENGGDLFNCRCRLSLFHLQAS